MLMVEGAIVGAMQRMATAAITTRTIELKFWNPNQVQMMMMKYPLHRRKIRREREKRLHQQNRLREKRCELVIVLNVTFLYLSG